MAIRDTCIFALVASALAIGCGSDPRPAVDGPDVIDADTTPDATPDAGVTGFGEACTTHQNCADGFCVEPVGGSGGVCTRECPPDCPTGWDCLEVELPSGLTNVCVPTAAHLCIDCQNDGECPGGACLTIDGGGRCATDCSGPGTCPTGYTCAPDASGMHAGMFCQPVTASCDCDAAMNGAMRTCAITNGVGTCFGSQTCDGATGWSACTAQTPATESCDGVDNDCDFVIDDSVGGGEQCFNGACAGIRTCAGASGFVCEGPLPMAEACNFIDDDCDTNTDEAFPTLGDLCSAGVGGCLRYGSQRCNTAGDGVECSAVAGTPSTEMCNQINDDCDGATDETFPTLGDGCTVGLGVCARQGTVVCRVDGTATECSATPGPPNPPETCNYLDDDCDGNVDDPFRNVTTGFYDQDTTCGSCEIDCTVIYDNPNAFGECVVTSGPQCQMSCDGGFFDLNASTADGCEFGLDATAIYVSENDPTSADDAGCGFGPSGTGAGNHPCRSIAQGIARANSTGRQRVFVADGTYDEAVTLSNGKSLFGGFRADTWERHLATTSTVIQGVSSSGNHDRTVIAIGITSSTIVEGFVVRGAFNAKPGGNSYAIYVAGSSASLQIRDNQIFAGRGGPGGTGSAGTNGLFGGNGAGAATPDPAYDSKIATGTGPPTDFCPSTNNRQYTNGGVRTCGAVNVNGGRGGGNRCVPNNNSPNTPYIEWSGIDGLVGLGAGAGAPGDAGDDSQLQSNGNLCVLPPGTGGPLVPYFGEDGSTGGSGSNAGGVAGCSSAAGTVSGGHWVGGSGSAGNSAVAGAGGGGGGGGGGSYCWSCPENKDRLGGHGGGGGAGGCGGTGGGSGSPGGGVFGIFVTTGTAPTIANNTIERGDGGVGGDGGRGGAGGLGGVGGNGGQGQTFCTGKGGRGGDGGNGGHGSGGGGGCGGSSYGIYTQGVGTPTYCSTNTVTGGSAGPGGGGGFSGGNSGGSGAGGVLQPCATTP